MLKTNLAVLMAERGLKIADVYEATGISKTTLMAISENTGKGIQYETMDKLCNFLNVSPKDFFVYAPYIFKFHSEKGDDFLGNEFDNISITVNKSGSLKAYRLTVNIQTPQGANYPVTKDDANFIVRVVPAVTDTDDVAHWDDDKKEFYEIFDSLAVGLQSDINNHVYKMVVSNLARLNGKTITALDGKIDGTSKLTHDVTVKHGMNVIVNLFDGRFTRLTKVPLFTVNEKNVKK